MTTVVVLNKDGQQAHEFRFVRRPVPRHSNKIAEAVPDVLVLLVGLNEEWQRLHQ